MAQPPRLRRPPLFAGLALDLIGSLTIVLAVLLPDLQPYRITVILGGLALTVAGMFVMLRARA